ncbi:MAG: hypothetical protein QJR13_08120 [Bacillota bacterium]|nr:hypothetical protein [Bacillota bacterium]
MTLSPRERGLLVGGASFLAAVALWVFWFSPRLAELSSLRAEIRLQERLVNGTEGRAEGREANLPRDLVELRQEAARYRSLLYPESDSGRAQLRLLLDGERLCRESGLRLVSRVARPGRALGPFPAVAMDLEAEGGSPALVRFLHALRQAPVAYDVTAFAVQVEEGEKRRGLLRIRLTVQVYLSPPGLPAAEQRS